MSDSLFQRSWHNQPISTAKAFGDTLLKLAGRHKNIVVLTANYKRFLNLAPFELAFPDRYFSFGNAEQNMVAAASGFAARGKIPFVCSFSMFVTGRAWEQIHSAIAYQNLNIKIVGAHNGLSSGENGENGATYQALEDIALMRVIPNMKVVCPADAVETKCALEAIVNDFGPTYLRLNCDPVAHLYPETYQFSFGQGNIYKPGTDVCIFSVGRMVHNVLEASQLLERDSISTMVVNLASIKPIDENLIVECSKQARHVMTVEDHQIISGLGSAVMEVLSRKYPMKVVSIGVNGFGDSGKSDELYKKHGLDAQGIYERVLSIINPSFQGPF